MNVLLRVSYNTLAGLCVGGKEVIDLLNGIAIIQTVSHHAEKQEEYGT